MKECEVFNKKLCLGCTGLGEKDWCGAEQCEIYQKYHSITSEELCKKIIDGIQEKIEL